MSIIVTGATGHFGGSVIKALLDKGADPQAIVATGRNNRKLTVIEELGISARKIDYDDPSTLDVAFRGAQKILLVSGNELGHRVEQHRNVIEAAKKNGIRQILYTSVLNAGHSPLAVAADHRATEKAIVESGLSYVLLRNGWYTENFRNEAKRASNTGHLVSSAGQGRIASAVRDDFAEAAALVLLSDGDHGNRTLELSGDTAWTYSDLAAAISKSSGSAVTYENVSPSELRKRLIDEGMPVQSVEWSVKLAQDIAAGALSLQTGELSSILGRSTISLDEALQ